MGDLVQFVDSLASSPTVRLDLNDETTFWVKRFDAPPPRLRRSMASNAMRDGIHVGSSSYDSRTLVIELQCRKSNQDDAAVEIQKLWRELDRANNWIKYQPNGLTKPVFFRTYRSDTSRLEDVIAQAAMREFTIEVLAEPFALGLVETLGPYTVTNDPAAGSNGCYFDVTGVIGDVAAPVVVHDGTRVVGHGILATRTRLLTNMLWVKQFESTSNITLGTDTTNPGGGPDAAMSGTGTNNYVRTSFATNTAMVERVQWVMFNEASTAAQRQAIRGTYRVIVIVRRSDTTSVIDVRTTSGETIRTTATTSRQMVDLGFATIGQRIATSVGHSSSDTGTFAPNLSLFAQRVSGTGTLDWDAVLFIPADEQQMQWTVNNSVGTSFHTLIDAVQDNVAVMSTGTAPLSSAPVFWTSPRVSVSGMLPKVVPNVTNRFFFLQAASKGGAMTKADTSSMTLYYWPRYLFVRPVST